MKGAADLFRFLDHAQARNERVVLVTIARVIGTGSRAAGTHMAVTQSGEWHGSFSGGCVEAAVVAEALRVLREGRAECIRFGVDSPFLDIRLPCGGGMDLLFHPDPPAELVSATRAALEQRQAVALHLHLDGRIELEVTGGAGSAPVSIPDALVAFHVPDPRVIVIGQGAEAQALHRIASSYGAGTFVLSPDEPLVARLRRHGAQAWPLKTPSRSPHLRSDRYTAIVLLFHDHDWEVELLAQALEQPAFFVGAMGSRRTHAVRVAALRARGVPDERIARVAGPVGLIPGARDPETLALSIMAQVAQNFEAEVAALGPVAEREAA